MAEAGSRRFLFRGLAALLGGGLVLGKSALAADKDTDKPVGQRYHDDTSINWMRIVGRVFQSRPDKPPQYKSYDGAKKIELPEPDFSGMALEQAIRKRRSVRKYSDKPLTLAQLSQLLYAGQGITGRGLLVKMRASPSAGALYPVELYIAVNRVEGLEPGLYHYDVRGHALEQLKAGKTGSLVADAALGQAMPEVSAVNIIMTSVFDRTRSKYSERAYRYCYMEAGHISQNICLQAVSLGLGSVTIGAFDDGRLNEFVGADGVREAAIYLQPVGAV